MVPWPSIAALLRDRARRDPHRELFRFEGSSRTVGQIDEASSRLAQVLVRRGIRKGDRVALMIPNGIEFPTCWMALAKIGAVMVPLNTQYQAADLGYVLADSGARLALAGAREAGRLATVRDRLATLETIAVLGAEAGSGIVSLAAELSEPPSSFGGGRRRARRPHEHPVHLGHDRLPQGLHAEPRVHGPHGHGARRGLRGHGAGRHAHRAAVLLPGSPMGHGALPDRGVPARDPAAILGLDLLAVGQGPRRHLLLRARHHARVPLQAAGEPGR